MEIKETAAAYSYLEDALADCGMEEDGQKQCLSCVMEGRRPELLRLLNRQRRLLMQELHAAQRKVDALDHVIRSVEEQKNW